jgi:LEA14-like dessication related protein
MVSSSEAARHVPSAAGSAISSSVNAARAFVLSLALLAGCARPKPVEVKPRSVQVAAIQPQGLELLVVLDVHNPNGFAITARDVSGTLQLENGVELGRGSASAAVTVLAEQTAAVPTRLSMAWTNLAGLAPYALSPRALPYHIVGKARIGGESLNVELPFDISGTFTREQVLAASMRGAASLIPAAPR